ncbi:MAG: hypothetical protein EON61_06510 [Alphaproteobacteria bacterium]|nr:MAG: hypothetical protein EON61_06510 [Alphaproteobacteria bacterium]
MPLLAIALPLAACQHVAPARVDSPTEAWLLGETHDNAEGHRLRAELLRQRIEAGWRPAIAMEQFDTGQQAALDAAMRECADAGCVVARVAPAQSGWSWDYYKPVIALALHYKLPLLAANLSRADASKVVKEGFAAALAPELVARYALQALPAPLLAAQEAEVRGGHCGMLPGPMLAPMARAQIARDVMMAQTLRTHAARGVVLIAGNGHVRNDIAVPYWLQRDGLASRAEGFLEPNADATGFDAVHRIPAATRPDPCAGFQAPKAAS